MLLTKIKYYSCSGPLWPRPLILPSSLSSSSSSLQTFLPISPPHPPPLSTKSSSLLQDHTFTTAHSRFNTSPCLDENYFQPTHGDLVLSNMNNVVSTWCPRLARKCDLCASHDCFFFFLDELSNLVNLITTLYLRICCEPPQPNIPDDSPACLQCEKNRICPYCE